MDYHEDSGLKRKLVKASFDWPHSPDAGDLPPTKRLRRSSGNDLIQSDVCRGGYKDALLTPSASYRCSKAKCLGEVDQVDRVNQIQHHQANNCIEDWVQTTLDQRRASFCQTTSQNSSLYSNTAHSRRYSWPLLSPLEYSKGGQGQRPLLQVLQEMSHSRRDANTASTGSSRNPRSITSDPGYRSTLRNNGIYLDHRGIKIPADLRDFLNSSILKQQTSPLIPEAIAEAVEVADEIVDGAEGKIYDLAGTALLPIKRSDVGRGGNTPWYTESLPKSDFSSIPLAQPKADIHCGYLTGQKSDWTVQENAVIDHAHAYKMTQPAREVCFPFLIFELKSEAMGGNLWQAENQAAGSGACCVNIKRWLYREAHGKDDPSVIDSIAFSACVTHRHVAFHVHHYSASEQRFYMSSIGIFETVDEVQECNNIISNIFKHSLGDRQQKTREQLKMLYPFPAHWKKARSASAMASQTAPNEDNESTTSKRPRTDDTPGV